MDANIGDAPAAQDALAVAATAMCPFCHEAIQPAARKCPHCQEFLDARLAKAVRRVPPVSGLALASFVLAVMSPAMMLLPGIPALFLGVLGIIATSKGRKSGRGLAVYGTLLGLLWTCLLVFAILSFAAAMQDGQFPQFDLPPQEPLF